MAVDADDDNKCNTSFMSSFSIICTSFCMYKLSEIYVNSIWKSSVFYAYNDGIFVFLSLLFSWALLLSALPSIVVLKISWLLSRGLSNRFWWDSQLRWIQYVMAENQTILLLVLGLLVFFMNVALIFKWSDINFSFLSGFNPSSSLAGFSSVSLLQIFSFQLAVDVSFSLIVVTF